MSVLHKPTQDGNSPDILANGWVAMFHYRAVEIKDYVVSGFIHIYVVL
jgi:hypothetical protein